MSSLRISGENKWKVELKNRKECKAFLREAKVNFRELMSHDD